MNLAEFSSWVEGTGPWQKLTPFPFHLPGKPADCLVPKDPTIHIQCEGPTFQDFVKDEANWTEAGKKYLARNFPGYGSWKNSMTLEHYERQQRQKVKQYEAAVERYRGARTVASQLRG